ncbi:MAG: type III restriction endonuclease subunit R [Robiginitomaculum sp.]|nr:MAG: type III restriction endonuclease subunit R [Robiginitomaculum sp.]
MAFRTLDYQTRVLETLDLYLERLKTEKLKTEAIAKALADIPGAEAVSQDYAKATWDGLKADGKLPKSRSNIPFSERFDACGRVVPNITLKVPTGGGKTFLAANAVSRIMGRYLSKHRGFVLWIVPNEAIYTQTLATLRNRQHPYRQTLDRAAAGRVKIMEKTDRLDARDVEANLCIMVLMLQSANRDTKDSLKMFQDRGDVFGFTPEEGDQKAHAALLADIPNLSAYDLADSPAAWPMVKDSLGNALRIIRPIVVMDEGQKAVSDLAFSTLYGFNPVFVLELSATPKDVSAKSGKNPKEARYANLLVEVMGRELDEEGMIKMPLNLDARQGMDWKGTLTVAIQKLKALQSAATAFGGESGRYIRPIMLVQVERTGKDQRGAGFIHADDVKDWMLTAGFDEAEIAIKTAEKNDLNQPENLDLLSRTNRVRVIITKRALQEGWDCPFAYVLCSLSASSNLSAMTQLVGRILRQPQALKTGVDALDECHVITHHAKTGDVVEAIKKGLEQDGLGDLVLTATPGDGALANGLARKIHRRPKYNDLRIFLPRVLHVDGDDVREFEYETDLLSRIDWRDYDPSCVAKNIPANAQVAETQLQRISLTDANEGELIAAQMLESWQEVSEFDPSYAVRVVSDLVPNPFIGRGIVQRLLDALKNAGFDAEKINGLSSLIITELRKALEMERMKRAEALFKADVAAGTVQFRLRLDSHNWKMPMEDFTNAPEGASQVPRDDGTTIEKSLFAPVYKADLNGDEQSVAVYLDQEAALKWWHRNVARNQYGLPGWRRGKIYPDFIFAADRKNGKTRLTILETKGDQLEGNLDTTYKRELLDVLSNAYSLDKTTQAGAVELVMDSGDTIDCALIMMSEWKSKLPEYLG